MGGGGGVMWTGGMIEHRTDSTEASRREQLERVCAAEQAAIPDEQLTAIVRGLDQVFVAATIDDWGQVNTEIVVCKTGIVREVTWEAALGILRQRTEFVANEQTID